MATRLVFITSTEILRLAPEAVVYIIADGNYSTIYMVNDERFTLTMQLGQIEMRIAGCLAKGDFRFVRIGKSLIINLDYVMRVIPVRQKIVLSDSRGFRSEITASKNALKSLKELLEKENKQ